MCARSEALLPEASEAYLLYLNAIKFSATELLSLSLLFALRVEPNECILISKM